MKRFLILTLALVGIAFSCQKVLPEGFVTIVGNSVVAAEGGNVNVLVSAGCPWTVSAPQGVVANPSSGTAGDKSVSLTIAPNTETNAREFEVVFTFTNENGSMTQTIKVGIEAYQVPEPKGNVVPASVDVDFWGGEAEFEIKANGPWTITGSEGVIIEPNSGESDAVVKVTVPANEVKEVAEYELNLKVTNSAGISYETKFKVFVAAPILSYDGVDYKIVRLSDGNVWMAENLRYVPAGFSASTDLSNLNGFYAPITLTSDAKNAEFDATDETIAKNGLFYSTAIAFGLENDKQLTAENAESFEGCQGICPEGWHIPTVTDMVGLVGKSSNGAITSKEAPYYDETLDNGSIDKLNEDGANIKAYGAITVTNTAAAKGSFLKTANAEGDDFNTGYFLGSSVYQIQNNSDGSLKNIQYYGFMPNMNKRTINVAYNGYRNGVSVRCVRNK